MRLLLTHGYILEEDPKERQIVKPYAPLGLLYLSSHLKACGFALEVFDSTFASREELLQVLAGGEPGVLGIYVTLMTRTSAVDIVIAAKRLGWRVIAGGPEPANYAGEYFDAGVDVIVAGEGERAMERLMAIHMDRAQLPGVPGILYREDGTVRSTGPAELIANLDAQPWPDREAIDLNRYLAAWRGRHGQSSLSLITARGCPYHCNWCSHSVYGKTHRRRSARGVVDEIEHLLNRYTPDMLWIADDVFTIHHGWLSEYAAEMRRRSLHVPFECITRADRVNERVADTLTELGCFRVWIGSESGSQRILDRMERGVTVEQVRQSVRWLKARGISTGMFLMWGYEGEELEDIEATVDHVAECRPDVCLTTVSYPIKGTPYYERTQDRLVSVRPWRESSDREWRVRGRHSREFYRRADELLRRSIGNTADTAAIQAARESMLEAAAEVEA